MSVFVGQVVDLSALRCGSGVTIRNGTVIGLHKEQCDGG